MLRKVLALILACTMGLAWLPQTASAMMTLEEERKLGDEAFEEIIVAIPLVDDPDTVDYVRALGKRLVDQLPEKLFAYRFFVANEPDMNAFAIPGGYIFMFRGMIATMENEAELAGVMSHEIGHVWRRHLARRMEKSAPTTAATVAGMLAGMLLGGLAGVPALGQAVTMGSLAGGTTAQLAFSREDEQEADWAAVKLMGENGYSPQEMVKSFNRIWRMERTTMPDMPVYLRTHPASPQRMEFIENMVRTHPAGAKPLDNQDFWRVQMRLIALYDKPENALGVLKAKERETPESPYPVYGMALLDMRQGRFQEAIERFESLKRSDWYQKAYLTRDEGICNLRMGQFAKAEALLNRALVGLPGDTLTLVSLGAVYLQQSRFEEAERVLRRVLARDADNDQALYDLGMALGKSGQTAEASFYLGMAFVERRAWRPARYHLERAVREIQDRPDLIDRANKALEEVDKAEGKEVKRRIEESQQGRLSLGLMEERLGEVNPTPWKDWPEGKTRTDWGQDRNRRAFGQDQTTLGGKGFSFGFSLNPDEPMPLDEQMRRRLGIRYDRGENPLDFDPYARDPRARQPQQ